MVWKQDLAKLKQQLGADPAPATPKPPPKAVPKPATGPIEEEDAVFLAAMGLKPAAPRKEPTPRVAEPANPPAPAPSVPESFEEALRDLKGLKPLAKDFSKRTPAPKPGPTVHQAPEKKPGPEPLAPPETETALQAAAVTPSFPQPQESIPLISTSRKPATPSASEPLPPIQFQLAAGMALEVDAALDLRGHSLTDAMERLKDRLGDGQLLGWRILQVTLGSDPILHEGLLTLLNSGRLPMVARYAQAPIPMGGNQAWLLYLGTAPTAP